MKNFYYILFVTLLFGCSEDEHPTREGNAPNIPIIEEFRNGTDFAVLSPIPVKWQKSHNIDSTYYTKMTLAWGIPIIASDSVDNLILKNAAELLSKQLSDKSLLNSDIAIKVRDKLWQRYMKVAIYSSAGPLKTKQLPEFKNLSSAAAYSATKELPTIGVSDLEFDFIPLEETHNVGNSFSHELTHSIHLLAISDLIPNFNKQLSDAYDAAISNETWPKDAYINANSLEYLAEGAEIWFGWHTQYARETERSDLLTLDPNLHHILNQIYNNEFPSFRSEQLSFVQPTIAIKYALALDLSFDYGADIRDLSQFQFDVYIDDEINIPLYRSTTLKQDKTPGYVTSGGSDSSLRVSLNGHPIPDPKSETLGDNYKFEEFRFVLKLSSGHVFFDCSFTQAQIIAETQTDNSIQPAVLNSYCNIIES